MPALIHNDAVTCREPNDLAAIINPKEYRVTPPGTIVKIPFVEATKPYDEALRSNRRLKSRSLKWGTDRDLNKIDLLPTTGE